ncbi:MAG: filamentous hemagglutinin N-terminal domain-containing protein, partial [Rhodocyclales bacterium]|nr:filamentous hemagglutinin N-terminal domain-containing protein [Rhodocyclales bacterium]
MKRPKTTLRKLALAVSACFASNAFALPSGPVVVNGSASISQSGNVLSVANSNGAILNWQKFGIAANEIVRFNQASASSSVLNRVVGADPSVIAGQMQSNGRVWLINPAGIMVGPGGRIDTAGFVASTLNVSNQDFLAGRLNFQAAAGAGEVVNQGRIATPSGGTVYLIGAHVANEGSVSTPGGETLLAAGQTVSLIDTATPGVKIEITGTAGRVTNLGDIAATAGRIGMAGVLVKNAGTLNASSVEAAGGRIFLRASKRIELDAAGRIVADGTQGGSVTAITAADGKVAGELVARGAISARGDGSRGSGGFVETSAAHVDLNDLVVNTRGGRWLIDRNDFTIGTDISGATLAANLGSGDVEILSSSGATVGNGDIFVNEAIAKTGATASTLTLKAERSIVVNQAITSTNSALGVTLNAHYLADAAPGNVAINANITTNGGNLTVGGGLNPTQTAAIGYGSASVQERYGIYIANSVIDTGSGHIAMRGQGFDNPTSGDTDGIDLWDTTAWLKTTGGNIALIGTAGNNATGGSSGVYVGGRIDAGGSGTLTISGSGGATTAAASLRGVQVDGGTLSVVNGNLAITGHGGNATSSTNRGVWIWNGSLIESTGSGNIDIAGDACLTGCFTATSTSYGNYGLNIDTSTVRATGSGAIILTGQGGRGTYQNYGVNIFTGTIAVNTGSLTVTGHGGDGTTYTNKGVRIYASTLGSTGAGNITISGDASATTTSIYGSGGIYVDTSTISTTAGGTVALTGRGGLATTGDTEGVYLWGSTVQVVDGALTITGYGGNATGTWNTGVLIEEGSIIDSVGTGGIAITGIACYGGCTTAPTYHNEGIYLLAGTATPTISSNGGTITLTGQGAGSGTGFSGSAKNANPGVYLEGIVTANAVNGGGAVTVTGTGGGATGGGDSYGVSYNYFDANTSIAASGARTVTLSSFGDIYIGAALSAAAVILRADNTGTGSGSVVFATPSTNYISADRTDLYYNPSSYASPTDYSLNFSAGDAWMLVNNATNLGNMYTYPTGNYALSKNIDASGIANFNPVGGTLAAPFSGKFDGFGHTISGLTISQATTDYVGLFGVIGTGGVVKNAGVIDASIVGQQFVGILAGKNNGGSISSSYSSGTVTGTDHVGGLVGNNAVGGTITDTYSMAAVNGTGDGAGGLVGGNDGSITTSYATGAVTGNTNVAGLIGINQANGTITNSFWDKDTTGQPAGYASNVGAAITSLAEVRSSTSTVNAYTQATYGTYSQSWTGFDFDNVWWMSEDNTRPILRSEYSTTVTNAHQLQLMASNLAASYTLANDIAMSELTQAPGVWNAATGFVPVGNNATAFTGTFDGGNHTISGLTILRPTENYIGLFGVTNGSSISNVALTGVNVSGASYVGGLVGMNGKTNNSTLDNASSSGTVSGGDNSFYIGGLVGLGNDGSVNNSHASGTVSGGTSSDAIGGMMGANNSETGTVSGSYFSSGAVNAGAGSYNLGGLIGGDAISGVSNSHYDIDNVTVTMNGVGGHIVTPRGLYGTQFAAWLPNKTLAIGDYFSQNLDGYYTVGTVQGMKDLLGFAHAPAYSFVLSADIDLSAIPGFYIPYLAATEFDGGGHVISNLNVNQPFNTQIGLFGETKSTSTVMNLGVAKLSVTGRDTVGGLVGMNGGYLTNTWASGSVSGESTVGGLAGYNSISTSITNSWAGGTVTGATDNIGGLIGSNAGTVDSVYASANVTVTGGNTEFGGTGGLIGYNAYGTINNAYATGNVSGSGKIGGLVGYTWGGSVSQTYATGHVSGTGNLGGLVGYQRSTTTNGYWDSATTGLSAGVGFTYAGSVGTPAELTAAGAYNEASYTGFDFVSATPVWWISEGNTRPILRGEYSTTITNAHQLQLMASNLGASYTLANDIDMRELARASGVWKTTTGFVPVGDINTAFTGSLAGGGHSITGLTINRPSDNYVGLFGNIDGGNIANVGLVGGSVTGGAVVGGLAGSLSNGSVSGSYNTGNVTSSIASYTGGLIGYSESSTITNSYATGTVSGVSNVGGLVGGSIGTVSNSYALGNVLGYSYVGGLAGSSQGAIENSYGSGDVSGTDYVGGLVGTSTGGTITTSYASGAVSGHLDVGGLVGYNSIAISDSYALGAVTGTGAYNNDIGGLVGSNHGSISRTYASGLVSGELNTAGLVGTNTSSGSIADSYWDTDTTGRYAGYAVNESGGVVTNLADVRSSTITVNAFTEGTYSGFNFGSTWWLSAGNTRPLLRSEYSTTIQNGHQLQLMTLAPGASYTLAKDIDLAETGRAAGVWNAATGFLPIGDATTPFTGNFNGGGHTVSNLFIARSADDVGLFGNIGAAGVVQKFGVVDADIVGATNVGVLAGTNRGSIGSSYVSGSASGAGNVGGLVGSNAYGGT